MTPGLCLPSVSLVDPYRPPPCLSLCIRLPGKFNAAIPDYFTDFPMVMFMISGVLLSEAGHAVTLEDRARVAETRCAEKSHVAFFGAGLFD